MKQRRTKKPLKNAASRKTGKRGIPPAITERVNPRPAIIKKGAASKPKQKKKTINEVAQKLAVLNTKTGKTTAMPVVRLQDLASLLNTTYQTLWRWSSETKQLPRPILLDKTSGREYPVYHVEEARVIIGHIETHLEQFAYFRKDHAGTIKAVFDDIDALRGVNFQP